MVFADHGVGYLEQGVSVEADCLGSTKSKRLRDRVRHQACVCVCGGGGWWWWRWRGVGVVLGSWIRRDIFWKVMQC